MFHLRGTIHSFAFDAVSNNVMYAISSELWRSADVGRTWEVIYPEPAKISRIVMEGDHASEAIVTSDGTSAAVKAFAVDPTEPNLLYLVLQRGQDWTLHKSANGGKTC